MCKVRGWHKKIGQRDSEGTRCHSEERAGRREEEKRGSWVHFLVLTDNEEKVWGNGVYGDTHVHAHTHMHTQLLKLPAGF